jgi:putative Holliday junction resolvase
LDLGSARIGVAISDADRRVAVPHGTVRAGAPNDVRAIAAIVRDNDVVEVVVGHPLGLSGRAGEAAHHAERFADVLRELLGLPVYLQDERLSTLEADRALAAAGRSSRDRRAVVDESAATLILQGYLDRTAGETAPSG